MNQVDGCCQHGELLDKYCPECFKEDVEKELLEAEDKEFNPKEGDRILVGGSKDRIDNKRIYIHKDKRGRFVCVDSAYEDQYKEGNNYASSSWPYAKPLSSNLPEFIQGDPVIVWGPDDIEYIRIVDYVGKNGAVKCFNGGELCNRISPPTGWAHYKPLTNYDYGGRNVWGSEDKK
jgi:hypothetical protein